MDNESIMDNQIVTDKACVTDNERAMDKEKAFLRSAMLIGKDNLLKLQRSHVAVFGVGGVGGFAVEALCRSGVGEITVIDNDTVSETNINRQIIATTETIWLDKTEVIKKRLESINPDIKVNAVKEFFLPSVSDKFDFCAFDYVIDAVDTVNAKIEIIKKAVECNTPIITCMGTGKKLNPQLLKVSIIENTKYCPLAKVVRKELKKLGIKGIKTVYSEEETIEADFKGDEIIKGNRTPPASMIFVPACAGLLIAKEVVLDLINNL